jgi:hypothetical protein
VAVVSTDAVIVNHRGAHLVAQAQALSALNVPPATLRVLVAERNLGFGRACNWAHAVSRAEHILLLNPDAGLMPGALAQLQRSLIARPGLDAVAPRISWTAHGHLVMPNLVSQAVVPRLVQAAVNRAAPHAPHWLERRAARLAAHTRQLMQSAVPAAVAWHPWTHSPEKAALMADSDALFLARHHRHSRWLLCTLLPRLQADPWRGGRLRSTPVGSCDGCRRAPRPLLGADPALYTSASGRALHGRRARTLRRRMGLDVERTLVCLGAVAPRRTSAALGGRGCRPG